PSAISPALPGASRGSASPMPYPRWSFGTGADRRTGWRGGPSWIGGRSKWLPRVILDLVQRWSPVGRIAGLADAPQVDRSRKTKDVGQVHGEEPEAKADGHRSISAERIGVARPLDPDPQWLGRSGAPWCGLAMSVLLVSRGASLSSRTGPQASCPKGPRARIRFLPVPMRSGETRRW